MSTTPAPSAMNPQKRKRTVVSYAELDQLPDLFSDDDNITTIPRDEDSDDESDNDDRTYSRNKKMLKKTPKKKKARHVVPPRQKAEKPFPFMELPPELRDMIYELALTDVNAMCIVAKTKAYRRTVCRGPIYNPNELRYCRRTNNDHEELAPQTRSLVPNLLAVSKQIHQEAANILYNQDFMFQDTDALHRFLTTIGPRNAKRLLSIDITNFCRGRMTQNLNHCAFMSLAAATSLRTVILPHADFRWYTSAKGVAKGLYCNAHFFLEAYGAAHGRKDAGIDIIQMDDDNFDRYATAYRRNGVVPKQPSSIEENRAIYRAELCRLLGAT